MTTPNNLQDATVTWLSALLDSASVDTIGVKNWWDRATAALATAATADTYGEATATAARKLQIDTLTARTAATVTQLETTITADYPAWQHLAATETPYLIALTRITRQNTRTKTEETK